MTQDTFMPLTIEQASSVTRRIPTAPSVNARPTRSPVFTEISGAGRSGIGSYSATRLLRRVSIRCGLSARCCSGRGGSAATIRGRRGARTVFGKWSRFCPVGVTAGLWRIA